MKKSKNVLSLLLCIILLTTVVFENNVNAAEHIKTYYKTETKTIPLWISDCATIKYNNIIKYYEKGNYVYVTEISVFAKADGAGSFTKKYSATGLKMLKSDGKTEKKLKWSNAPVIVAPCDWVYSKVCKEKIKIKKENFKKCSVTFTVKVESESFIKTAFWNIKTNFNYGK